MSVPAAFIATVLIWATTPLAIKWSTEDASFIFGATSRMGLSALVCLLILLFLGRSLPWRNGVWRVYVAAAIGIYGALMCVYWGAQSQTSGMISVLFGLTPLVTSALAYHLLQEQSLTTNKIFGMVLGVAGLLVIFFADLGSEGLLSGLVVLLIAVFLHAFSTVAVKRSAIEINPFDVTAGGLLVSLPLYLLSWWFLGAPLPEQLPPRAIGAIFYLALFGSVLGFVLYFYVLRHSSASQAGLIPLLTPVIALWLGSQLNSEEVTVQTMVGTSLILLGLCLHQWGARLFAKSR